MKKQRRKKKKGAFPIPTNKTDVPKIKDSCFPIICSKRVATGSSFFLPRRRCYYRYHTLIAMHQNKGKSISACLADRTDYAKNPVKTNDGELLSSYQCCPRTVQGEFMLSKRQYDDMTGRKQASNVITCQIRQAFKPREISPELANKIGYELGISF
ncbi:MAG: hypothetical protein RR313_12030, partial [Anaerovoracaceae bacterium]